jgi:phosphoglycolate phosphatase-like HAD superfamily hydrolase
MNGLSRMRTAFRRAIRKPAAIAALCALAAAPARCETFCTIFFDLGNTLLDQSGLSPWPLFADAQSTIDELQARGIRLGIITNVPAGWDRDDVELLMQQPAFLDEFDVLALSSEAGASKPDPAIYLYAYGLLPSPQGGIFNSAFVGETLSEIGNSVDSPTSGARAVGMTGIHRSSAAPNPIADYTIANLTALLAIATESCFVFVDGFESEGFDAWSSCAPCG